jgi:hypothetical protein
MTAMAQPEPEDDPRRERALADQREQFHRELMRRSLRITELELELDEQRARYEASLSWRLTKPLRFRSYLRQRRDAATGD